MSTCPCVATEANCIDGGDYSYSSDTLVMWQLGDFGVNSVVGGFGSPYPPYPYPYDPNEQDLASIIDADDPGLIITSGDNDYVGNYMASVNPSYGEWVRRSKFWPVPGNHDWDYGGLAPYLAYFSNVDNQRYFAKRFGPVEIFFLDSGYNTAGVLVEPDGNAAGTFDSNGDPVGGSIQWNWFVDRVRASTAPWKFAVAHHPDLTSGSSHGPYPAMAWQWSQLGIRMRFAGHEHSYERLLKGTTTHIVCGTGGQTLTGFNTPLSPYSIARYNALRAALRLEITAERISGTLVDQNGGVHDTFTLTR